MLKLNEILVLGQDRYTDSLIDRHVFGEEGDVADFDNEGRNKDLGKMPNYSTNILDSYKIVQRLKELGYRVRITEAFNNCKVEVFGSEKHVSFVGVNTELTISKSALYFLFEEGRGSTAKQ